MTRKNWYILLIYSFYSLMWPAGVRAWEAAKSDRYYASIRPTNYHAFYTFHAGPNERKLPLEEGDLFPSYAIGKFQYSPGIVAYVARIAAPWGTDAIFLSLVDKASKKEITSQLLAVTYNENDEIIWKESWLLDVNSDGYLDIVTKKMESRRQALNFWFKCHVDTDVQLFSPQIREFKKSKVAEFPAIPSLEMSLVEQRAALGWCQKSKKQAYIPEPGSTERKSILNAVRAELGINNQFEVRHLKAKEILYVGKRGTVAYFVGTPIGSQRASKPKVGLVTALLEKLPDAGWKSGTFPAADRQEEGVWNVFAMWHSESGGTLANFRKAVEEEVKAAEATDVLEGQ